MSSTQFTIASTANPGACSSACGSATGLWAFTTTGVHTFAAGNPVFVGAVVPTPFNGLWAVNAVGSTTSFTVTSSVQLTYTSGGAASGSVRRSNFDAHGLQAGQTVTLTGVSPASYNGEWDVGSVASPWQIVVSAALNPGAATVTGFASPIGYSVAHGDFFTF